jgi:hypothetical protein
VKYLPRGANHGRAALPTDHMSISAAKLIFDGLRDGYRQHFFGQHSGTTPMRGHMGFPGIAAGELGAARHHRAQGRIGGIKGRPGGPPYRQAIGAVTILCRGKGLDLAEDKQDRNGTKPALRQNEVVLS